MHRPVQAAFLAAMLLSASVPARAELRVPHIFGDHMVLQRDIPVKIWGWAAPGETITAKIGDRSASAEADQSGMWRLQLTPLSAGGPHELVVSGTKETLRFKDVLVGEVWLCSGQSNMEMGVGAVRNGEREAAAADHPRIRLCQVARVPAGQPNPDVGAQWRICSPQTIVGYGWGGFSAVGYFFGRELQRELDVPIGLISSNWGGMRIEPFTPAPAFSDVPALKPIADEIAKANATYRASLPATLDALDAWSASARAALESKGDFPPMPNIPVHPLAHETSPSGLYNGMIAPLAPFGIRGAIWYQGESNVIPVDSIPYVEKMKGLIGGWREAWGQGDFPFLFVQIAPFNYAVFNKDVSPFAEPILWESQAAAIRLIPNTGMAVTVDISNLGDIHPANKQEVGRRLALWALAKTYGRTDLVCSGPLYKAMQVEGSEIRIRFDHAGGGLATRDGLPVEWLEIAGEDRKFEPASAKLEGDALRVWSEKVPAPVAVRYGWHMLAEPNLINKEGLPASPFRTDNWE